MNNPIDRRKFLQNASAAAAVSFQPNISKASPQTSNQAAVSRPRLLSGCCAYSYRKYLEKGQMTVEEFILKAVELGIDGVDVTTYWLKSTEPAYLASLRHFAFKQGVAFSGAAIATEMCQPDAAKRRLEVDKISKWADATELLGAPHLRVFGGDLPAGATERDAIRWTAETMKAACAYAAKKGITLGIESHGGITSKASSILEILCQVDSPYAGINLDFSNLTENQYAQTEACIPYTTHTHIRDVFTETRQPIDLDRVWQIFANGGYKGFMSAEYEGDEDAMTAVPKLVEKIKSLCRKYSSV